MRVTQHAVVACLFVVAASVTQADEGWLRFGPDGPGILGGAYTEAGHAE
jgi:hypothetical protein